MIKRSGRRKLALGVSSLLVFLVLAPGLAYAATTQQTSGSIGLQGTVPGPAPSQAPTITVPSNGQGFTTTPITVSGLCQNGLLVEIFKNGVFAGATECSGGSYSLQIDLFSGRNDLVAQQFDALNQGSPNSATVSVTFNNTISSSNSQVSLTTDFSKRGANPGDSLTWPLSISGGTGPYAVSVDWGDKSALELVSLAGAGDFSIEHIYQQAGTYNVTIKATDVNGNTAYLQVVGVGNGPVQQTSSANSQSNAKVQKVIVWWPYIILILLAISTFWLGQRHQLEKIRARLRRGERPFK